jgi:hypothetical protein
VSDWLTLQTFIAFVLGVLMSAMVKGLVSQARSKIA